MTVTDSEVPQNAADQIKVARALLARLYKTQTYPDLFAAVVASVHVADWHFLNADQHWISDEQREFVIDRCPEFETLSALSNGLKHGLHPPPRQSRTEARLLVLKRIDAWGGDDEDDAQDGWHHLGKPDFWIVQHGNGRRHSVYLLCERFLDAMEAMALEACPA